jgi:hypothetical protein
MRSLVPCSACNRHVGAEATVCPFCGVALIPQPDPRVCVGPCSGHASPRLSRAARAAVGATLLCAACLPSGSSAYGTSIGPPPDAGTQSADAGGQTDGGDAGAKMGDGGQTDAGKP